MSETTKVRLWFKGDTTSGKARIYSRIPKSRNAGKDDEVIIGMSTIEHTSKRPAVGDEWPEHVVTLPDWLVSKEKL